MEALQGGGTQLWRGMCGGLMGQGRVKFQRFPSMETGKWLACLLKREKQFTLNSMGESTPAWGAGAPGVCSHQPLPSPLQPAGLRHRCRTLLLFPWHLPKIPGSGTLCLPCDLVKTL